MRPSRRLKHPSAGRAPQRGAGPAARRRVGRARSSRPGSLRRPRCPGPARGLAGAGRDAAVAEAAASVAGRRAARAGAVDGDRWLADAATAAAAAHDRGVPRGPGRAQRRAAAAPADRSRSSAAWPSTTPAAGPVDDGRLASWRLQGDLEPRCATPIVAGLAKGWPQRQGRRRSTPTREKALDRPAAEALDRAARPAARPRLALGRQGTRRRSSPRSRRTSSPSASDDEGDRGRPHRRRPAARSSSARPTPQAARDVLALITPQTSPELATGLIDAVGDERRARGRAGPGRRARAADPGGPAGERPGAARPAGLDARAARRRSRRARSAVAELSLDQKQALAAHPDKAIAERAKALLAKGGGLPDPDRQKVIDALAPLVLEGRRRRARARSSSSSTAPSATRTAARGARSAPT